MDHPDHVPEPLAHDPVRGLFTMSYLDPDDHSVWKDQLLTGRVRPDDARAVGALLVELHSRSNAQPALVQRFATDENFETLRITSYLRSLPKAHPDLADIITAIITTTRTTKKALVHGDVSPKNILIGPHGPVLLDAECAWFGDPAFAVAFVLNHLLLKMLVVTDPQAALADSADALLASYTGYVSWEPTSDLCGRIARLLPALLLARVAGLSPVEYPDTAHQARVRAWARQLLTAGSADLDDVITTTRAACTADT
ncbi:putative aminoglycoside phosphotransferase [Gordonia polyisoprenivorans VH2]|uniref:Putative aminoglycoside phosphotransferase n=1 Tax=Gordonia polyisoprenivorans (strain DSM 44266 / VH2) TaxID=1112204 RepID=H6N3R5_GORPV|nr:phosphotransferase [Gordonia polyisoprenivorans]AFA73536.1 putative aminoglycoside phosphotransferase [Gordonia polyisoprenivorans VH2]